MTRFYNTIVVGCVPLQPAVAVFVVLWIAFSLDGGGGRTISAFHSVKRSKPTSSWRRAVTEILIFHNGWKVLRFIMNEFVAAFSKQSPPTSSSSSGLVVLSLLNLSYFLIAPPQSWLSCELWQWVCIVNYA